MEEIVRVHYPDVEENLLKNAMEVFYNIRAIRDIRKKPTLGNSRSALSISSIKSTTCSGLSKASPSFPSLI